MTEVFSNKEYSLVIMRKPFYPNEVLGYTLQFKNWHKGNWLLSRQDFINFYKRRFNDHKTL